MLYPVELRDHIRKPKGERRMLRGPREVKGEGKQGVSDLFTGEEHSGRLRHKGLNQTGKVIEAIEDRVRA